MQSMAQFVDESLTLDDLPTLGSRLELPEGWAYQARTLDADLVLIAWVGAIADAVAAALMPFPAAGMALYGVPARPTTGRPAGQTCRVFHEFRTWRARWLELGGL